MHKDLIRPYNKVALGRKGETMAMFYSLVPLAVTVDDDTDWVAKVKTKSATVEDAADLVLEAGNEYTRETLIAVFAHMEGAIRTLLAQGYSVTTANTTFLPTIKGTFSKSGVWDEDVNRLSCTVTASKSLKTSLADVRPVFTGQVDTAGGAAIDNITDATTGATDGTITPGGVITVTGRKIKCVGEDGMGVGAVEFLDALSSQVVAQVSTIVHNSASKLILVCPDLAAGSYVLEVRTYYTTGRSLKSERAIMSPVLTVL